MQELSQDGAQSLKWFKDTVLGTGVVPQARIHFLLPFALPVGMHGGSVSLPDNEADVGQQAIFLLDSDSSKICSSESALPASLSLPL